jgi:adenylate kinase
MRYKAVLLFGAPGSGKGTQGKILGTVPGFYHFSCGDVFRTLDLQSDIGRQVWGYTSRGELVPDELTIRLWKQYIRGAAMINVFHPQSDILVLDGIPRNTRQAELIDDTIDVLQIIHLLCADPEKMVERLRRRALKENRLDDANDTVIRHRLSVYMENTKPLLAHYPSYKLKHIDATASQLQVLNQIIDVLIPLKMAAKEEEHAVLEHEEALP